MTKKKETLSSRVAEFHHLVLRREFDPALNLLRTILASLESGSEGFGGSLVARGPAAEREATVLAGAVTSLLGAPDYVLNTKAYTIFTQFKRAMMQVFEVSGYRGTDHFLATIGTRTPEGAITLDGREVPKLFAGLSVNRLSPDMLSLLAKQQPEISWPFVIGYLSEQLVWSPQAEAARSEMLSWGDKWKDMPITLTTVRNIGPAYMGCSYADAPHKHDIKKAMNHLVRRWLEMHDVTDIDMTVPRRAVKRRPTIVILAELYDSKHAMHRCYGPSIKALKKDFKIILMTTDGKIDPALEDMFDKIDNQAFDPAKPKAYIDKVKSYRPDIVYFPSVGMRLMSIFASNVRMAPIQVMTFGHPATTHSPHIDYVVLDPEQIGSPDTVSETILFRTSEPRFHLRDDADNVKPVMRLKPATVRIAVPAWSRKVTPRFFETCQEIQKRSKRPVEFWFFPNGVSSLYQSFARRVESMLNAKVFPRAGYKQYITWLNQCDIFLSTFPFGATNGIVDAMRQGLPIVNMTGGEVHEANDGHIVQRFDQPEWLTTNDQESYINAVLKLVEDDALRVDISKHILECDPDSRLVAKNSDGAEDFAHVMKAAYRHHEVLKGSGRKTWDYETLKKIAED